MATRTRTSARGAPASSVTRPRRIAARALADGWSPGAVGLVGSRIGGEGDDQRKDDEPGDEHATQGVSRVARLWASM